MEGILLRHPTYVNGSSLAEIVKIENKGCEIKIMLTEDLIGLFHFLSIQGDGRKKFRSIFALEFFDMNILSPGKQLGEFSVSLEFHSELRSIFASFVLSKCQWM